MKKLDFILIGVIAGLTAVLDYIGVIGLPTGVFSISTLYIGGAFYTLFGLWFRKDAYIGMYLGLLLGAVISGTFTPYAFLLAWGNVLGVLVVVAGFKYIKALDYRLVKYYDYIAFVLLVFLGQIVSSNYTIRGLNFFGLIPDVAVVPSITSWIIGGMIVNIVIAIPLLKILTPIVESKILKKYDVDKK
ncbi:TPA: hypothetical protein GX533_01245 [Candidatus Dojkabacteria bacterium]|jgi:hypothetical protein|uniref:ECF transporter S component n=1 Tax=Candidatus Dojkabacteria bacterium TaxID=2099670 RepID=A0A832QBL4_9BACT|nr:hypothetical protein [Candidatus Dojkabacteria bacterium]